MKFRIVTIGPAAEKFIEDNNDISSLKDAITGWSFRLAREPTRGAFHLTETNPPIYIIRTPIIPAINKSLTIKYHVTNNEVHIINIKINELSSQLV